MKRVKTVHGGMLAPEEAEGARRATGGSSGAERAAVGALEPGQRWSVGRKREVVLRLLRGESLEVLSRELGVEIYRLEEWRQRAFAGTDASLREREAGLPGADIEGAKQLWYVCQTTYRPDGDCTAVEQSKRQNRITSAAPPKPSALCSDPLAWRVIRPGYFAPGDTNVGSGPGRGVALSVGGVARRARGR